MCHFPSDQHYLTNWKGVLSCCDKCTSIVIPGQEPNRDDTKTCPTIRFHVYRVLSCCTVHVRLTSEKNRINRILIVYHSYRKQKKRKLYTCTDIYINRDIYNIISSEVIHYRYKKLSFYL